MTLFAFFVLLIFAGAVRAQEPPPVSGRIQDVDDSDFPEVRAIVTVLDAAGVPITGLTAGAFGAVESGAPAAISHVETVLDQQLGVAVILVIDTSGSMQGAPIDQARGAAQTFVESLAEADEAAVVSFAEGVSVESALTSDRAQTLAALAGLAAIGNTALYSAVVEAVEVAQGAALPRKAIILLSDGQDFGGASQSSRQEALDLAAEAGVPVYAIGLGQEIDRPFLEALVDGNGGVFIEAPAPERIPEIYRQLSQLLRSQYVVTLASTASAEDAGRRLALTVTTPQGQVELATDYTTRRTIVASAPTPLPSPAIGLPEASPGPEAAGDDSGSGLLLPLFLIALAVSGPSLGYLYYKRLKQRRALTEQIEVMSRRAAAELDQQDIAVVRHASVARTHRLRVTGPDFDQTLAVGDEPLVIGSDAACQVPLPVASGVAAAHARLWVREGNLVLHHLAPGYESLVAGRSATWVTLELADEVHIGPYLVRVEG